MKPVERVLVVVAHADDESFWMGATIANLTKAGAKVSVLALSDGVGSREFPELAWRRDLIPSEAAVKRLSQFQQACRILRATPLSNHIFPDQRSDSVSQLSINKTVEVAIRVGKPDEVYTHHVGDLNLDHRRVAEAVLVATRPGAGAAQRVFCMRPEWPSRCVGQPWYPTVEMAFTQSDSEDRLAACLCYTDEVREYPHPRSERAVRERHTEHFMEIR